MSIVCVIVNDVVFLTNVVSIGVSSKQTNKMFSLFRFFSVFRTYIKTTETNRTVSKQTETTLNFLKNTKACSLSNCFSCSSVCFGSIKHQNSLFRYRSETTETNCFETNQNKPKQTETNRSNPKFSEKIQKYALFKTV
jgi:hypothetical protein